MRKVVVVVPWGEALGGAEKMLLNLLDSAEETRCIFDVVFLESGPFVEAAESRGAKTHVVETGRLRHGLRYTRAVWALRVLLRRLEPDVALAWSPKVHLYLAPAVFRLSGQPTTIWWQHGVPRARSWIDRVATALPTRSVGCSSRASALAQSKLRPRRATFVVHPGAPEPAVRARRGSGRRTAGIVGRLQPSKGQHRFVEALAGMDAPIDGLIVGGEAYSLSHGYREQLERLIAERGLTGRVKVMGQVPDATALISSMDVLVNACEDEAFGLTLIEAMACGVPVVAVDGAGPAEIIQHGRSGILVPSGSPADLAAGIATVLAEAEEHGEMAAASRRRYEERFSASAMARAFGDRMEALMHA